MPTPQALIVVLPLNCGTCVEKEKLVAKRFVVVANVNTDKILSCNSFIVPYLRTEKTSQTQTTLKTLNASKLAVLASSPPPPFPRAPLPMVVPTVLPYFNDVLPRGYR